MRPLLSRDFLLLTALIVGASAVRLLGQPQSDQKPLEFEVASIKPNSGGPESGIRQFRGGRYITRYATLKELISHAYGVRGRSLSDRQVVGAPTWLGVDRFDIQATAPGIPDDSRGMIPAAVQFVRAFFDDSKPVASICHGPWTIVEADKARGRRMTSWPSVRTDLRNAGAEVVDEEAVVDGNLVTSRKPDDIPAFNREMIKLFAAARGHRRAA